MPLIKKESCNAMIEGIRIRNYRALKDIKLGKLWNEQKADPLTPLTVVIGKNGVGKSSLFDAFGFLADCLKFGVEEAFERNHRGGYEHVHTKGSTGGIFFEIYFREAAGERPITYELEINLDEHKRPYVAMERLRQRRKGQKSGRPFSFLLLNNGAGIVWKGDSLGMRISDRKSLDSEELRKYYDSLTEESKDKEWVELEDKAQLGIATLGSLKQHPRISLFRKFIESWYLSYFTPDSARSLPMAGAQKKLSVHGDNLGNVVQYMERQHADSFRHVLKEIAKKIPGLKTIDTEVTPDRRLLLRFYTEGFEEPFYAQQMSDGTLKVFTYLLLMANPDPSPFVCIEEPENGLYHKLLETLAKEFRESATNKKNPSQVFITTHQPYFVNNLKPNEVWIVEKSSDGYSRIRRASDDRLVRHMVEEGIPLGSLWYSEYLDNKSPLVNR